ncbi:MAG: carboxypeptidase-like regulatory domain-containing protein, partial [Bacteroidales bacterium]|nr:carboxypeptidase-like regulatory domain-containing protein [Bacteroidales bacterium]
MLTNYISTSLKIAASALFLLLFVCGDIWGQSFNQRLTGVILDKESRLPISHATVTTKVGNSLKTVLTDSTGSFSVILPVGRHSLNIYAIGYSSATVKDILIGSGKEVSISVELTELRGEIQQAVVSSDQKKSNNSMATV